MTVDTIALRLDPLDVLFFRDGKPFEAGIRASSTEPLPQTLAGALRTHVLGAAGCDFAGLGEAVRCGRSFAKALAEQQLDRLATLACRGPWFARDMKEGPLLPMPAVLHRLGKQTDGKFVRLAPKEPVPPWWQGKTPRPLWTDEGERTTAASGWLTLEGMRAFLDGGLPRQEEVVTRGALFDLDTRTGIVIGERGTTEEGRIYAADYLALQRGVWLYAEITGPAADLQAAFPDPGVTSMAFGGQGRRVQVTRVPLAKWPAPPQRDGKRVLVLTSPGVFAEGWKPRDLAPVAAAVPRHVAFSGWDLARRGPKPTRFAAVAGSVFYFDSPPNLSGPSLCDDAEDALVGWGSYLEGIWR